VAALANERRSHLKQMMKDWEELETTLEEPSPSEQT
jgi:hypothetical protein